MSIERRIAALADQFAKDVLAQLKGSNLEDLLGALSHAGGSAVRRGARPAASARPAAAPAASSSTATTAAAPRARKSKAGRLMRRSPEQLKAVLEKVVATLKSGPKRAEQIQATLGLDRKELPAVIKLGLSSRKLAKKGEKRATMYSAK